MADTTKTVLGNYVLQRVLGDGAEGRVYLAICAVKTRSGVAVGEQVAVKRLYKKAGQEKEPQLFRRQVDILSKLDHPNIVRYRDSFVWHETELEEDLHCLVMELLDGEPLKALLEKNPRGLPWEKARNILQPILEALHHASERGVIHRDLKPSNIHLTSQGAPKLVDFGIARQDEGDDDATNSTAGAKGTFDYMAPDFAKDGKFRGDEQSDIFSFGVILHQALTGTLPFPPLGEDANRGYFLRWLGPNPPAPDLKHPVYRVLNLAGAFVSKCIHSDRAQRFKSFAEVIAGFQQIGFRKLKHGAESYEFTEWLGKGGFGEVFKARRIRDQRAVAIKRLFGAQQSTRFIREAKILRESVHPNLTEYLDFVEAKVRDDEKDYYLILEYLEGMPAAGLRERIKASVTGLEPVETLQLFSRYLDCLDHLHRNGIIHRDLKPGNLYAPAGQPQRAKIFDLGIAHDDEGTKTHGQIPGTLDYMPPEFASQSGGRGSAQSDLYSLGVTLYQTLTRKLPQTRLPKAEADAWVEFFRRSDKPSPINFDHPVFKARPELIPLLQRALAHKAADRFPSAVAMRDEVNAVLIRWELKAAGRSPDQGTEATLFVKSTAVTIPDGVAALRREPMPALEEELQKAAAEVSPPSVPGPAPKPAPETQIPAVVEPDPVELENARLAAVEAARKSKEEESERLAQATKQTGDHAAETAARRKLMEAKWQEEEEKRKAGELAAQELQRQAEAEEAEKKRLAQEQRARDIAEIKATMHRKVTAAGAIGRRFFQAVGIRLQKLFALVAGKWQAAGGFRGLGGKIKTVTAKGIVLARSGAHAAVKNFQAARSSDQAKGIGQKVRRAKEKSIAGGLVFWHGVKKTTVLTWQKWQGLPAKKRLIIIASTAVLLLLCCALIFGETRSHLRTSAYDRAVAQAKDDFQRGDFAAASSESARALAIRGDDPALQQLARESREQYTLHASLEELLNNGQTALENQDYTNALQWAAAALNKSAGDATAVKLQATAQQRLDDFLAAAAAAQTAFAAGDFTGADSNATSALTFVAKDPAMLQLKASVRGHFLAIASYQSAIGKARSALNASDYSNAVFFADEALKNMAGDAPAAQLRARAQKNLDDYHQAVSDAYAAFTNANYLAAQEYADMALSVYLNDRAMQQLKIDAQTRFTTQKTFVEAMRNAQTAMESRDYTNALQQADTALQQVPGERNAAHLRDVAKKFLDDYHAAVNAAFAAYKNADYLTANANADNALAIYPDDSAMQQLKLRSLDQLDKARAYQAEIARGQAALAQADFTSALAAANNALSKVPNDPAATKLKTEAQQAMGQFDDLVSQAKTAFMLEDYGSALSSADKALQVQSQNPAMLQMKANILRHLDQNLIELLSSFGIATPDELQYAELKTPSKLGPIGETGKPYYRAQVDQLEKIYRAGNWLDSDNRQKTIDLLRSTIAGWD